MANKDFTARLSEFSSDDLHSLFSHYQALSALSANETNSRYHRILYAIFGEIEWRNCAQDNFSYRNLKCLYQNED